MVDVQVSFVIFVTVVMAADVVGVVWHSGKVKLGVGYPAQFGKHPPQVLPQSSKKSSQMVDVQVFFGIVVMGGMNVTVVIGGMNVTVAIGGMNVTVVMAAEVVGEQDGAVKLGVLDPGQSA